MIAKAPKSRYAAYVSRDKMYEQEESSNVMNEKLVWIIIILAFIIIAAAILWRKIGNVFAK